MQRNLANSIVLPLASYSLPMGKRRTVRLLMQITYHLSDYCINSEIEKTEERIQCAITPTISNISEQAVAQIISVAVKYSEEHSAMIAQY